MDLHLQKTISYHDNRFIQHFCQFPRVSHYPISTVHPKCPYFRQATLNLSLIIKQSLDRVSMLEDRMVKLQINKTKAQK